MALTTCSECGGKVSNSAKTCPHCGFDIKTQIETDKLTKEISNIPFPNHPICTVTGIVEIIVFIIALIIGIILPYMLIRKIHIDNLYAIGIGIIVFVIIQSPFIGIFISLIKEYSLAKTDFSEYQKQKYFQLKEDKETAQYVGLWIGISISGFILYVIIRLLVKVVF